MGTFNSTYSVTYQNGSITGAPIQGPFSATLTDGDADLTFELGDSVNVFSADYTYVGTETIDGQEWPAFTYDPDPTYTIVFMDQLPVSPPSTTSANGATFNGACFVTGTLIATPKGQTPVEELSIEDEILTSNGQRIAVKWIGHQTISTRFGPAERLMPVRFAAGSLGDGLPHSDLTVTADHGMLVEGVICHAGALVNGTTITRVPLADMGKTYTVYHIETEEHEIILANGSPAETFIDNVSRRVFDNFAEFDALYGDMPEMQELPYPRAMSARQVPASIRAGLRCATAA